jgi:hypothetical protein
VSVQRLRKYCEGSAAADPQVSLAAKGVWLTLARHADAQGRVFLSIRAIAAETASGIRSVQTALDELIRIGYLTRYLRHQGVRGSVSTLHLHSHPQPGRRAS